jgi:hypothetical protein
LGQRFPGYFFVAADKEVTRQVAKSKIKKNYNFINLICYLKSIFYQQQTFILTT